MIRTQIQLEEEQMQWLREKAGARGVSVSQLIREGVSFYRSYQERFTEDKKNRAMAAVGRFASNLSDVSERHDVYLAEAYEKEVGLGK